jgi:excisionase family DNA binding protein
MTFRCCDHRAPIMTAGPKQGRRGKRARNPNRRSIKIHRNYTVEEAARATGSAKGTIRRWIKSGALPEITDRKPNLILGGDLFDYLTARATPGPKLRLNECYSLKCRAPREPAAGHRRLRTAASFPRESCQKWSRRRNYGCFRRRRFLEADRRRGFPDTLPTPSTG